MTFKSSLVSNKKSIIIFTSILTISALIVAVLIVTKNCSGLKCIGFDDVDDYSSTDIYRSDQDTFTGLYSSGIDQIRLDVRAHQRSATAAKEVEIMIAKMDKLYEKERAPYPGEISDTIACSPEFIPQWNTVSSHGVEINYTIALLNDRMVYGSCDHSQIMYKSLLAMFYCPDQEKLYQMEFIGGKDIFDQYQAIYLSRLTSLRCL